MKYLGIDYGQKRVGLAISDDNGEMAFPLSVFQNTATLVEDVLRTCLEYKIEKIVMGESLGLSGEKNDIYEASMSFKEKLSEKTGLDVVLFPEFFTSAEAERVQGKNNMLDASSAAIILKHYLDTEKNKK